MPDPKTVVEEGDEKAVKPEVATAPATESKPKPAPAPVTEKPSTPAPVEPKILWYQSRTRIVTGTKTGNIVIEAYAPIRDKSLIAMLQYHGVELDPVYE